MSSKLVNALVTFFAVVALFYLFAAFVAWDLNPGNWDYLWRFMFIFIASSIGSGFAHVVWNLTDD
jgi:ABC-type multidrug transport system permease subunit